jgi:hypothetical protein
MNSRVSQGVPILPTNVHIHCICQQHWHNHPACRKTSPYFDTKNFSTKMDGRVSIMAYQGPSLLEASRA